MNNSGKLIVFEGIDKSGKTTQIKLIENFLKNKRVKFHIFREPGGTDTGELIRKILLNPEIDINYISEYFLFVASRFELILKKILPYLKNDYIVILDRFHFSSFAYQVMPNKEDSFILKVDRLIGEKIFSMVNVFHIFFFYKSSSYKTTSHQNKFDRIEKKDKNYFLKVENSYKKAFNYYRNFKNIITMLKFEDGIETNFKIIKNFFINEIINKNLKNNLNSSKTSSKNND